MKKKVLSVLLCAAMVTSLVVGCGGKKDDGDAAKTDSGNSGRI